MTSSPVPTSPYGGVARRSRTILLGLVALTVVYLAVFLLMQDSGDYLPPADKYCTTGRPCSRPDLFAFQVSAGFGIFYCGMLGFHSWHVSRRAHTGIPSTPEGRLFGYLEEGEKMATALFTFQVWDFFITLFIPEHFGPIMLTHHAMAAIVSWFSLSHQVLHHYGIFFLGVTEVSSMFLVFVDMGRYFPPAAGSKFGLLISICGPMFLVTFFVYRIVIWWVVSYTLWKDVFHVIRTGSAERLRPGKSFVLKYIYLPFNVLLGLLQMYWFSYVILPGAIKTVRGEGL